MPTDYLTTRAVAKDHRTAWLTNVVNSAPSNPNVNNGDSQRSTVNDTYANARKWTARLDCVRLRRPESARRSQQRTNTSSAELWCDSDGGQASCCCSPDKPLPSPHHCRLGDRECTPATAMARAVIAAGKCRALAAPGHLPLIHPIPSNTSIAGMYCRTVPGVDVQWGGGAAWQVSGC